MLLALLIFLGFVVVVMVAYVAVAVITPTKGNYRSRREVPVNDLLTHQKEFLKNIGKIDPDGPEYLGGIAARQRGGRGIRHDSAGESF